MGWCHGDGARGGLRERHPRKRGLYRKGMEMGQGNPPERGKDVGSSPSAVIWGALEPNFQVIKLWQGLEKVGGGGQGEEFQTLGWWGVLPKGCNGAAGCGQEWGGGGGQRDGMERWDAARRGTAVGQRRWDGAAGFGREQSWGGVGRGGPGANPG